VLGGYKDRLDVAGKSLMAGQLFRFRWTAGRKLQNKTSLEQNAANRRLKSLFEKASPPVLKVDKAGVLVQRLRRKVQAAW
jgi:hypothetical protein